MENFDRKKHWENIYTTKEPTEVSWYQPRPATSLDLIKTLQLPTTAKIIDVGGGDSLLVDHLLDLGYTEITVLDISAVAIEKAKYRLGEKAQQVIWIVSDVTEFKPATKYDCWHDRAAFHFLTTEKDIETYIHLAEKNINPGGYLLIGTFSTEGPTKCSGIQIKQYSEASMTEIFSKSFKKMQCMHIDHRTPFGTNQNFIFCYFRRRLKLLFTRIKTNTA